jgi:hypothetical protein
MDERTLCGTVQAPRPQSAQFNPCPLPPIWIPSTPQVMLRTHNSLDRFDLPAAQFILNMLFFLASFLLHIVVSIFMFVVFVRSLNRLTEVSMRACVSLCIYGV